MAHRLWVNFMKVKFPLEDRIAYVNCRSFHAESANIQNDIFTVRFVYFIILSKRAKSIHFYPKKTMISELWRSFQVCNDLTIKVLLCNRHLCFTHGHCKKYRHIDRLPFLHRAVHLPRPHFYRQISFWPDNYRKKVRYIDYTLKNAKVRIFRKNLVWLKPKSPNFRK